MTSKLDPKEYVASLPKRPGVYRMYGADGELLYVGKASSLKDRVGSYFHPRNVSPKVQALVSNIASIEVTLTGSETEALLLEYNLIKEHRPRYNVSLRDDKSFPYLYLDTTHEYPKLVFYRGSRKRPGRFFGPFPSAGAVKETLHHVQKLFRIRNCRDTFFANRSRPCLQHQINRCTAPCVGLITPEEYARDVQAAVQLLEGRNDEVRAALEQRMEEHAARLEFERAAHLRDQLAALKRLQARQIVTAEADRDLDVFAIIGDGEFAVSVLLVRGGRTLGTTSYFPKAALATLPEALASFLMQYYAGQEPPPEVLVNLDLDDREALSEALGSRAGRTVQVRKPARGLLAKWLELTRENAEQALRMRLAQRQGFDEMLAAFARELDLPELPGRIECFDISHTGGEGTVASCVVFGPEGALKGEYRRLGIKGIAPGDDYGAMRQAIERRYTRIRDGEIPAPDVLLVDGGLGQVNEAHAALASVGFDELVLIGVAKGSDRRPGQERLFVHGEATSRTLPADSPTLHLIQRIRDEAHRFAITGHRRKRARRHTQSVLESVAGLGPAKRRALLKHFGGLQGVMRAGVADLEKVEGIGTALARTLYDHLHPGA
jgi:excinuclease ABC subunit C